MTEVEKKKVFLTTGETQRTVHLRGTRGQMVQDVALAIDCLQDVSDLRPPFTVTAYCEEHGGKGVTLEIESAAFNVLHDEARKALEILKLLPA